MGLPGHDGNWRGYEESDLTYKAPNLLGRDFYLIQGTGGDIVHFEQSMTLVRALVESNVMFRQQVETSGARFTKSLRQICKIFETFGLKILRFWY